MEDIANRLRKRVKEQGHPIMTEAELRQFRSAEIEDQKIMLAGLWKKSEAFIPEGYKRKDWYKSMFKQSSKGK